VERFSSFVTLIFRRLTLCPATGTAPRAFLTLLVVKRKASANKGCGLAKKRLASALDMAQHEFQGRCPSAGNDPL